MSGQPATAAAQAATTIREQARWHKRAERSHRRQARELMAAYEELTGQLAALGITVEVATDPKEATGDE